MLKTSTILLLLFVCTRLSAQIEFPDTMIFYRPKNVAAIKEMDTAKYSLLDSLDTPYCYLVRTKEKSHYGDGVLLAVKNGDSFFVFDPFEDTTTNIHTTFDEYTLEALNFDDKRNPEVLISYITRSGMSSVHGHGNSSADSGFVLWNIDNIVRIGMFQLLHKDRYWGLNFKNGDNTLSGEDSGFTSISDGQCEMYNVRFGKKKIWFESAPYCSTDSDLQFLKHIPYHNVSYRFENTMLVADYKVENKYYSESTFNEEFVTGCSEELDTMENAEYYRVPQSVLSVTYPRFVLADKETEKLLNDSIQSFVTVRMDINDLDNPPPNEEYNTWACIFDKPFEKYLSYILHSLTPQIISYSISIDELASGGANGAGHDIEPYTYDVKKKDFLQLRDVVKRKFTNKLDDTIRVYIQKQYSNAQNAEVSQSAHWGNNPITMDKEGVRIYFHIGWGCCHTTEEYKLDIDKYRKYYKRKYRNIISHL